MSIRLLAILLILCSVSGCSFDSTFFPIDERPDDVAQANQQNIVLKSTDGKNIHHFLIKPQTNAKATIFVFHGSGSKVSNWTKLLKPLVKDGYQIFLMEYRGFGNSEGEASHENVAADANRAFLYLIGREDVKNKPLVILGQSYGGQLAINIAAKHPEHVDVLITEGTFTSFQNIAVYSTPWIGKPFTWTFFRNPYSSVELIKKATMPKLIIHSYGDDVVPFFMGEELFALAASSKEFWQIQGKHADALADYPKEFVVRLNRIAGLARDQKLQRTLSHIAGVETRQKYTSRY
jgi:dipeptidyl aminopeptidase/acylaminoacyl peptidase